MSKNMVNNIKHRILSLAAQDMAQVEIALKEHLCPNLGLVQDIASHLLFAGGKRLRPLLMIHASRICGYSGGDEVSFSVLFEYLHAATLLHDDVVDGAAMRRNQVAAHHKWNPSTVVLTGDFLLARALDIAAATRNPRLVSVIARVTNAMSQGEIDQLDQAGKTDLDEENYCRIIEGKTAVLIQGACQSGAILAHAQEEKEQALARFGHHLGMAFQMADDLLDYTASAGELGKNPGADLREGKLTMPMIKALERARGKDRDFLLSMIGAADADPEQFQNLTKMIDRLGGIAYTRNMAKSHVEKAKLSLGMFDPGDSRTLLELIADYAIQRRV